MGINPRNIFRQTILLLSLDLKLASRTKGFWGRLGLFRVFEGLLGRLAILFGLFGIIPILLFSKSKFSLVSFFNLHTAIFIFIFLFLAAEQGKFSLFPPANTFLKHLPFSFSAIVIARFTFLFGAATLFGLAMSLPGVLVIIFKLNLFPALIFGATTLINTFLAILVFSLAQMIVYRLGPGEFSAELAGYSQVFLVFFFVLSVKNPGFYFLGIREWGFVTRFSFNPMIWLANLNSWGCGTDSKIFIFPSLFRLSITFFFLLSMNLVFFLWRTRISIHPGQHRPKCHRSWSLSFAPLIRPEEEAGFGLGARLMFRDPLYRARVFPLLLLWLLYLIFLQFRNEGFRTVFPWAFPVVFVYGLFFWGLEPIQALHIGRNSGNENMFYKLGEKNLKNIQRGVQKSAILFFLLPLISFGGLGFGLLLGRNFIFHFGFGLLFLSFFLFCWLRPASWVPFSHPLQNWYSGPGFNKLLLLFGFYLVHLAAAFAFYRFFIL